MPKISEATASIPVLTDLVPIARPGDTTPRHIAVSGLVALIPAGQTGPQGEVGPQGPAGAPGTAPAPVYAVLANGATAMEFATNDVVKVTPTANATLTTTVPAAGKLKVLIVLTSGTTSRTLTFGAGFKPTATLATGTTTGRVFVISWVSDGVSLYEMSRTVAMVA